MPVEVIVAVPVEELASWILLLIGLVARGAALYTVDIGRAIGNLA